MTHKDEPGGKKIDGRAQAVELLAGLDTEHREKLLQNIAKENPSLAAELRSKLHSFEDLGNFDDGDLQKILRDIPPLRLALCLRACSDGLKEKIFSNLSSRMADQVQEEVETMGPQPLSKVRDAQQQVMDKLEADGKFD